MIPAELKIMKFLQKFRLVAVGDFPLINDKKDPLLKTPASTDKTSV